MNELIKENKIICTKDKFGLWMLIALVIGNTIGAGIFMLPATLAKIGSISLFSWIFTSSGAILFAFVFSKMSKLVLKNGGPYAYARAGFGKVAGFQVAFTFWISLWTGNSSLIVTLIAYLRIFFPELFNPFLANVIGISIIWLIAAINIAGIKPVGIVQIITTLIKLLPIVLVIIIGAYYFHPEYLTQSFNISHKSDLSAFSYAATLTLWAFVGMESACVPTGAIENPKRNIYLATIIGTVLLALVYIASSVVVMGALPLHDLIHSASPFASVTGMVFGKWGKIFIAFCVTISCLGALNSGLLLESQVPMAAADDNLFPKIFARRNQKGVPGWGLVIDATLMSIFVILTSRPNLADQFQLVITIAAVFTLVAYLYSSLAEIIILSKNKQDKLRKTNLVVAILASIYAFWAIFGSGQKIVFYVALFLFLSLIVYVFWSWHEKKIINSKF